MPRLFGGREVLRKAGEVVTNDRSRKALTNLQKVLEILEVYGVENHVTFDLGELRGLDYYTGVTFQGFLSGFGRAVCFGGRYDNLTASYGYPAPATGFAFNLLNLLFALDKELDSLATCQTDVLIFQAGPRITSYNVCYTKLLRIRTQLGPPQRTEVFDATFLFALEAETTEEHVTDNGGGLVANHEVHSYNFV